MSTLQQQVVQPTVRISRRWIAAAAAALCATAVVLVLVSSSGSGSAVVSGPAHVSRAQAEHELSMASGPRFGQPGGYNPAGESAHLTRAQAEAQLLQASGARFGQPGGYNPRKR